MIRFSSPTPVTASSWEPSTGDAEPILAVPIERRNDFIGFALYGREHDGTAPDPEIIAHLGELADAAATTYELVEARSWRDRYHELRSEIATT
jgi:hypothetical protein